MTIKNFDIALKDIHGDDIIEGDKPALMRTAVVNALMGTIANENIPGEEKAKRYDLGLKINKGGDIDLTVEELATIKKLVGANFGTLVVGQVFNFIDSDQ